MKKVPGIPGEEIRDELRVGKRLEKVVISQGFTTDFLPLLETFKPQCSSAFTHRFLYATGSVAALEPKGEVSLPSASKRGNGRSSDNCGCVHAAS